MSELLSPGLSGAVAGLGVAMPMGAMSVLLLQEAMRHRRTAVAAAAGVAAVDLGYAVLATALGPWVAAHVAPVEAWIRLTAAAVLLTLAARGLSSAAPARRSREPSLPQPPAAQSRGPGPGPGPQPPPPGRSTPDPGQGSLPAAPATAAPEARGPRGSSGSGEGWGGGRPPAGPASTAPAPTPPPAPAPAAAAAAAARPGKAFATYVALTAVNPTTALYFAALTTAQAATLRAPSAATAFVAGVGVASLLWQQVLVALGALAGRRVPATARAWTFRLGYGLVIAYAVKIAFPLPWQ
ncbi:LysE family transporter [Streptomyces sp. NPDC006326]|uniref:LysE family transporter n=1 Tax=Streptomyces sp. NPDC006326 TaxID=3156752 RepID=UPI0033B46A57